MSIFDRLFGKKPTTQAAATPETVPQPHHETKPKADAGVSAPKPKPQKKDQAKPKPSAPEPGTENAPWRTFSIFISSTFADMQAERDHLKNVVFPRVEEELQKRRIKLEIVDLRWGVDTTSMAQEDEREANVLKVCLDEIRRCRPFFIGLLGDRYGWVPPLERMKTALLGEKHILPEKGKSVTDLEIEFGVLASKEQLVRSIFYFREPLPYDTFSKKKAVLFSDEYNNELSEAEKKERKAALEKLKINIINHFANKKLENKVKTYSGAWDAEKEKLTGLETWGETVYLDILKECESHAKATWDKVPQNWQEQELALFDAFIETNTTTFCGRKPLLEELKQHLLTNNISNWGLVLTGESGSGKSAVFSRITKMMQERKDCFILAHSAGLSPRAKSVADLLRIWNKQLADHLDIKEEFTDFTKNADDPASRLTGEQGKETTTPIEKLQERFLELLQSASAKKRVVLLIDALDRFEPTARAQHLSWLPSVMPQNVRFLCTAITGTEQKAVQYHKGLTAKSIDVFSTEEAKEMLDALCLRQHKSLPAKIEKIILEKRRTDGLPAITSPLWLSLAVNMLMTLDNDDFEKINMLGGGSGQQIESYMIKMADGFDSLPGPLFLSLTNKAGLLFGDSFTAAVFNYLAISRNGLREKDLEKILPATNIAWDPLKFANLRRWFKAHLVLQGEELQWNLAHSILRSALTEQVEETQRKKLHNVLAGYLMPLHNDMLKATETIYHLINAGNYKEAALYYSSDLTAEEAAGATTVLAEIITADDKGLVLVSTLPGLVVNEFKSFHGILKRFIYFLNVALEVEGNLNERLVLLEMIKSDLEKTYGSNISDKGFGYDTAAIYGELGSIHQLMGHMVEALKYFENCNQLFKELYEANPRSESLKNSLAISYEKLGEIDQSMGHMEEALKYFDDEVRLFKELYEANPRNINLLEGLGISYYKLAMIYKSAGNNKNGMERFKQWKDIISFLAKNVPQVSKYREWDKIEY
jgi:tetratricopeptide (TPR) repeat protein